MNNVLLGWLFKNRCEVTMLDSLIMITEIGAIAALVVFARYIHFCLTGKK